MAINQMFLRRHYDEYYKDGFLSKWREVCAKDKTENIIALWSAVENKPPSTIVDIGCGDGAIIRELIKHGFGQSYIGFEVSESGISHARQHRYDRPTRFVLFDGMCLPVRDCKFDLVILSHVLEHLEEPRQLLSEVGRIAKFIFIEVPLELNLRTSHKFKWTPTGHINLYNPLLARHLLQSSNLRILCEKITCPNYTVSNFQYPGPRGILHWAIKATLLKLMPRLAYNLFTYNACLIAQPAD